MSSNPYGSGVAPADTSAFNWRTKWWNHAITDTRGVDGRTLQRNKVEQVSAKAQKKDSEVH